MSELSLAAVVAAEIRAEVARQRLTGREVAARMGKPSNTVARWLRGETAVGFEEVGLFARALEVSPVEWIAKAYSVGHGPEPAGAINSGWRTRRTRALRLIRPTRHDFVNAA